MKLSDKEQPVIKKATHVIGWSVVLAIFAVVLMGGRIIFQDIGQYPDKMWLHRCNSMEKLREKQHMYPNVEVDLTFRDSIGKLDVTHDEEVSFNLYVDSYFSYMKDTEGKMWMDVKNLNSRNKKAILAELNRLTTQYHVDKKRLIIESPAWEELALFTQYGYYTSFYVPFEKPSRLSREERERCMVQLRTIADSRCVCALSFSGDWYRDIKQCLDRNIDLLTWKHRSTQLEILMTLRGREMLRDEQLKVILVKDKGKYHR